MGEGGLLGEKLPGLVLTCFVLFDMTSEKMGEEETINTNNLQMRLINIDIQGSLEILGSSHVLCLCLFVGSSCF